MGLSGQQFVITAGDHEATIVEVGGGVRLYRYAGRDVVAGYPEDVLQPKCAGGVLVPWPNRLRDGHYLFDGQEFQLPLTEPKPRNAIHGLGRWERWRAMQHEPDSVTLRLDVVPQTGWPFELRVEVRYALHPEAGLIVSAEATNVGSRPAPFGAGFHPYLSTAGIPLDEVTVTLPAAQRLVLDEVQVPVGDQAVHKTPYDFRKGKRLKELRMDDGFTALTTTDGRGAAEVHGKGGGARIWFDETYRYLQVYTLDDLAGGGPAVAIEPMTCAPDAFNSGAGLIVLDPGSSWTGAWGITPITA